MCYDCNHTYALPHLRSVSVHIVIRPLRLRNADFTVEVEDILEETRAFKVKLEGLLEGGSPMVCHCAKAELGNARMKKLEYYWNAVSDLAVGGDSEASTVLLSTKPRVLFPFLRSRGFHEGKNGFRFRTHVEMRERVYRVDPTTGALPAF
ncbi:hypothetical protein CC2G_013567 [Coprinopsis cinerea AmutBmut pab1-1]|nr:hypothetical protein CC2G_013567 [Coprinopsis cinerea AmutBmut pab1-1]